MTVGETMNLPLLSCFPVRHSFCTRRLKQWHGLDEGDFHFWGLAGPSVLNGLEIMMRQYRTTTMLVICTEKQEGHSNVFG